MPFFTIFTATYNRAYILPELYHSLCEQSCQDFEWLIVDDGSRDDTESLVKSWMERDSKISIRYYYKRNEGKPRAINYGVALAKGQYFFMVDSDDILLSDAVKKMKNWCLEIDTDHHFIGVGAARGFPDGKYIKGIKPKTNKWGFVDATNLQRKQYDLDADMCEAYKTNIFKKFPMAEVPGESFAPEQIALNNIALSGYKIRWHEDIIYVCDYLDDGLTKGSFLLEKRNPIGYAMMYNHMLLYPSLSWKEKLYAACQHIALSIYGENWGYILKSNRMIYTALAFPVGIILSFRRKKQFGAKQT